MIEENIDNLERILRLLREQHDYLYYHYIDIGDDEDIEDYKEEMDLDCQVWFLEARINNIPYGGIYAFYQSKYPEYLFIQGISKFAIPYLSDILFPENTAILPKLNSILQVSIESLAKKLNVKKIYVKPVGKQGNILNKHYGYAKTSRFVKMCWEEIKNTMFMLKQLHTRKNYAIMYLLINRYLVYYLAKVTVFINFCLTVWLIPLIIFQISFWRFRSC